MFDQLVESTAHHDDSSRKGWFLLGTFALYFVLFGGLFVFAIDQYDRSLTAQNMADLKLIANVAPKEPISGGVLNGKAISLPKPPYPPIAKAAHASGTVTVQVTIDESGKVISAHAVSGHPLLQQSAVQAAYQARFTPTQLSGQPVKVTGVITYNFVAQ